MPTFLKSPSYNPCGPDGRGMNRLRTEVILNDQCAFQPKSYAALKFEARDTRRARWGTFGMCLREGKCESCALAATTTLDSFMDRVLVRIGEDNAPWVMNRSDDGWGEFGKPVTWSFLARLEGWEIGDRYTDGHSKGFWLLKANVRDEPRA